MRDLLYSKQISKIINSPQDCHPHINLQVPRRNLLSMYTLIQSRLQTLRTISVLLLSTQSHSILLDLSHRVIKVNCLPKIIQVITNRPPDLHRTCIALETLILSLAPRTQVDLAAQQRSRIWELTSITVALVRHSNLSHRSMIENCFLPERCQIRILPIPMSILQSTSHLLSGTVLEIFMLTLKSHRTDENVIHWEKKIQGVNIPKQLETVRRR